jgi:DNA mismatch repair protein MutS2
MEKRHLDTLDFPLILERLAQHTSFSAGRKLALSLQPTPVFAEVRQRMQETREARYLLDAHEGVSLGGVHDIRPQAHQATRGAILQPPDLLDIENTLRAGRRVRRVLARLEGQVPSLADMASRIEPCEGLADEIGRCINGQGEVVDQASAKLSRVRREMRVAYDRLQERLNRIITNSRNATYLQEALITQRSGRFVIPIKADFKGRIPGIVHDTSSSGATVFIEPLSVVEMGNQWRQLQIEEQKEIERILAEISAHVADLADELSWTVEALAELDLALAKARYANAIDASEPEMVPFRAARPRPEAEPYASFTHPGSTLDLRQARHPLLNPQTVVPIDVSIDAEYFILVITGPNTGGKTVSLKTVGLMAAMAQSGLHLPVADGSSLSVFEGIYADIGDEQSIEQSLSTFSSHLTNLVQILSRADGRSLLLLDELGAGTDPVEGSALARALLSHLLARRITTLVATHYSELKAFAHTTPGVENASLKFDLETLSPTYQLVIGLPGRSNAFAIAERLGLNPEVVRAARGLVSPEDLETESLLAEIQQAHQDAVVARDEAARAQRKAAELEHHLSARLAAIEGERAAILGEARAQSRREIEQVRAELETLQAELTEHKSQATLGEEWLAQARARLEDQERAAAPPPPAPPPEDIRLPGEIEVGDTVWVAGLGTTGQVTALDGDSAEVQVGTFGVHVETRDLERRGRRKPAETPPRQPTIGSRPSPGMELDLRGQRVDEILPRVEKYLDEAFLAGLPYVRIIHGKGTGALRQAVQQELRNHPLVQSYRAGEEGEGGSGVTVAYLAGE